MCIIRGALLLRVGTVRARRCNRARSACVCLRPSRNDSSPLSLRLQLDATVCNMTLFLPALINNTDCSVVVVVIDDCLIHFS